VEFWPGEGALRAAQHLDGAHVVERLADELVVRDQLAVEVERDAGARRRRGLRDADAADVHEGRAVDRVDRDRRCDLLDVRELRDAAPVQLLAGEHGGRDRDGLQVLLAPLGGDEDFLEAAVLRFTRGRGRGGGRCQARGQGGGDRERDPRRDGVLSGCLDHESPFAGSYRPDVSVFTQPGGGRQAMHP
jgi:hypothetical protein